MPERACRLPVRLILVRIIGNAGRRGQRDCSGPARQCHNAHSLSPSSRGEGEGGAMFKKDPDRQPRRDRRPHHPAPRAGSGVGTVAVVSEADRGAPFARMADEVVEIGPGPATESYLRGDRIIAAARETEGRGASTRATASSPRTPTSPRPSARPASSSSARRPTPCAAWAARPRPRRSPPRPACRSCRAMHGDEPGRQGARHARPSASAIP